MKTLAEHAAELRTIAGAHFDYTFPARGPRADTHDAICDAADALEQAAEVLRACGDWRVCPVCFYTKSDHTAINAHAPDCKLAALIGAKP